MKENTVKIQIPIKTKNMDNFKNDCKNITIKNTTEIKSDYQSEGIVIFDIECEERYKNKIINIGFKYF